MIVINEQNLHNHHPDQKEDQNHYQQVVAGNLEGSDPPPPPHHHHYDQYEACISRVIMIRTCMKRIRGLNVQGAAGQGALKPVTAPGSVPMSTLQADIDVVVILDSLSRVR